MTTPEDKAAGAHAKSLINLLRGWPNTSLLPTELLKAAANSVLSDPSIAKPGLLYGPDSGSPQLRDALAAWLTEFYAPSEPVTTDRITITGGASQNLACLLQVFTDPIFTRNVWIVAPAYFLAFRILSDSGFHGKMRAVPEDEEGVDIQYLKRELEKSETEAERRGNDKPTLKPSRPWGKIYRHIIYAVPTFSNPSSRSMSLKRREALVRVARDYDALIITDDVYDFLQWPSGVDSSQSTLHKAALPRIVDVDRCLDGGAERDGADGFGNAASNGSFSKIAAPGLRTGWLEGAPKLAYGLSQVGSSASGGCPSTITSEYLARLLKTGQLQEHIFTTLQPAYASRHRTMLAAIEKHLLPLGVSLPQTDRDVVGGYFVWLTLPPPLQASRVTQKAKEVENLIVAEGGLFEVPGDNEAARYPRDVRLCFAWEDEHKLSEGVERLANVIGGMLKEDCSGVGQGEETNSDGKDLREHC